MTKLQLEPKATRKSVTLPEMLWQQVSDYRFANRIDTESEAVRRLIQDALKRVSATVKRRETHDQPSRPEARLNQAGPR